MAVVLLSLMALAVGCSGSQLTRNVIITAGSSLAPAPTATQVLPTQLPSKAIPNPAPQIVTDATIVPTPVEPIFRRAG